MKKDGLTLLLLFAQGPMREGACGDSAFLQKSERFLKGDHSLRQELEQEIPQKLITAWPFLSASGKKKKQRPLDYKIVAEYIFNKHNRIARPDCRVMKGKVVRIATAETMYVRRTKNGPIIQVRYLDPHANGIKPGDTIAFHRGWLIGRKPQTQCTH